MGISTGSIYDQILIIVVHKMQLCSILKKLISHHCFSILCSAGYDMGHTVLAVIGKAFASVAFTGVYIVAAEIFPTPLRNFGVGMSSTCSRIANLATPFMGAPLVSYPMTS